MRRAINDHKFNGRFDLLISAVEFVRLVDWHLRILISVEQQQWWILLVDVAHWASQSREGRNSSWLASE